MDYAFGKEKHRRVTMVQAVPPRAWGRKADIKGQTTHTKSKFVVPWPSTGRLTTVGRTLALLEMLHMSCLIL